MTTPLRKLLTEFRDRTLTERDKGTSFENLIVQYFKTEPFYKEKYIDVLSYADWVEKYGEELGITNGLLHSEKYADNLTKQLPRIPRVKTYKDFAHFSNAGRELAELHLNYETVSIFDKVKLTGKNGYTATKQAIKGGADSDYYVTKMKFGKKKDPETNKSVNDLSTVIYNNFITIENIPEEAYDYVVNGKSALEWVMERQSVTTHKDSGITNDANDWAIETMKNARYPLELFLRVITVSLETQKIVNGLPKLDLLKD